MPNIIPIPFNQNSNPSNIVHVATNTTLQQNLQSGFTTSTPATGFPIDNRANKNRGTITSRKNDTVQDVSIGLQDHDEAIAYYFNNIIKPEVIVNGNRTPVPLMYGSPERWKGVQKDGYIRDKEGKLQVPLIMFKRDSVEKRRDLGNKVDGNNPQLYYTFQERYTKINRYDNFAVLQNRIPVKEFHTIVVPDYVNLKYTCTIWTDYIAQMNKLIESINYTSDTYWGNPEKFKFNAKIDSYDNTTEITQGDNRIVKTNFNITLQGYLIPDSINKELAKKPQKFYSKSTVVFNSEVESTPSGTPLTREEVRPRKPSGTHKPPLATRQTILEGVGYQIWAQSNLIGGNSTAGIGAWIIEQDFFVGGIPGIGAWSIGDKFIVQ